MRKIFGTDGDRVTTNRQRETCIFPETLRYLRQPYSKKCSQILLFHLWYIFAFFRGKWDSKIWHCNFFHLLIAWMPNLKISCRIFKHSQRSWERSGLINHHISYLLVPGDKVSIYRKVMSSSLSRLVAHPWISRLLISAILPYEILEFNFDLKFLWN